MKLSKIEVVVLILEPVWIIWSLYRLYPRLSNPADIILAFGSVFVAVLYGILVGAAIERSRR